MLIETLYYVNSADSRIIGYGIISDVYRHKFGILLNNRGQTMKVNSLNLYGNLSKFKLGTPVKIRYNLDKDNTIKNLEIIADSVYSIFSFLENKILLLQAMRCGHLMTLLFLVLIIVLKILKIFE